MSKVVSSEMIIKRMNDIDTFMSTIDNETLLQGTDEFGEGQVNPTYEFENLDEIHTYGMCIDRLNERFTKQLNTLK